MLNLALAGNPIPENTIVIKSAAEVEGDCHAYDASLEVNLAMGGGTNTSGKVEKATLFLQQYLPEADRHRAERTAVLREFQERSAGIGAQSSTGTAANDPVEANASAMVLLQVSRFNDIVEDLRERLAFPWRHAPKDATSSAFDSEASVFSADHEPTDRPATLDEQAAPQSTQAVEPAKPVDVTANVVDSTTGINNRSVPLHDPLSTAAVDVRQDTAPLPVGQSTGSSLQRESVGNGSIDSNEGDETGNGSDDPPQPIANRFGRLGYHMRPQPTHVVSRPLGHERPLRPAQARQESASTALRYAKADFALRADAVTMTMSRRDNHVPVQNQVPVPSATQPVAPFNDSTYVDRGATEESVTDHQLPRVRSVRHQLVGPNGKFELVVRASGQPKPMRAQPTPSTNSAEQPSSALGSLQSRTVVTHSPKVRVLGRRAFMEKKAREEKELAEAAAAAERVETHRRTRQRGSRLDGLSPTPSSKAVEGGNRGQRRHRSPSHKVNAFTDHVIPEFIVSLANDRGIDTLTPQAVRHAMADIRQIFLAIPHTSNGHWPMAQVEVKTQEENDLRSGFLFHGESDEDVASQSQLPESMLSSLVTILAIVRVPQTRDPLLSLLRRWWSARRRLIVHDAGAKLVDDLFVCALL